MARRMDGPRRATTRMVGASDDDVDDIRANVADNEDGRGERQ